MFRRPLRMRLVVLSVFPFLQSVGQYIITPPIGPKDFGRHMGSIAALHPSWLVRCAIFTIERPYLFLYWLRRVIMRIILFGFHVISRAVFRRLYGWISVGRGGGCWSVVSAFIHSFIHSGPTPHVFVYLDYRPMSPPQWYWAP